jgi:hypothetical protein
MRIASNCAAAARFPGAQSIVRLWIELCGRNLAPNLGFNCKWSDCELTKGGDLHGTDS